MLVESPGTTITSFFGSLVKSPSVPTAQSTNSVLEVILLRYFVDVLARWFDLCDPEKHFELIVPHRARWCPPLRNAILASAARHLTRVSNPSSQPEHVYYYEGRPVQDLNGKHIDCVVGHALILSLGQL